MEWRQGQLENRIEGKGRRGMVMAKAKGGKWWRKVLAWLKERG